MISLLDPYNAIPVTQDVPRVVLRITGDETPADCAPAELTSSTLPTGSSGGYRVVEPLADLVRTAAHHVQAFAVLEGDAEADKIVERLIRAKRERKQPLGRK